MYLRRICVVLVFLQIVCAIFHSTLFVLQINYLYYGLGARTEAKYYSSPISTLFENVANSAAVVMAVLFCKIVWLEKGKLLALLEHTRVPVNGPHQKKKVR